MSDCNDCKYCYPNEKMQVDKKVPHICIKYSKQVYHMSNSKHHYRIVPCVECLNQR